MTTAVANGKPTRTKFKAQCKFQNANIGDATASIGVTILREHCTAESAEKFFCGKRLQIRIVVGRGDPSQKQFWEDLKYDVEASVDCKSYRVSPKRISTSLVFPMDGIDVAELGHFAKQEGWIIVTKAKDAEQEEDDEDDDKEGDDEDAE